jgi:hypothetical protein
MAWDTEMRCRLKLLSIYGAIPVCSLANYFPGVCQGLMSPATPMLLYRDIPLYTTQPPTTRQPPAHLTSSSWPTPLLQPQVPRPQSRLPNNRHASAANAGLRKSKLEAPTGSKPSRHFKEAHTETWKRMYQVVQPRPLRRPLY